MGADLAGSELDFDQFYSAHFAGLAVQLYAYLGDRAEAQDVVQEAFCRAWQRWSRISAYEDPVAWVRKVAWRLAISRWRRTKTALAFVRRQREEHVPAVSPDRVALAAALATLPVTQRRAVVLHYLAGLQISEIAAQEGVAEGTVKSWLHRGRAALASRLTEESASTEGVGPRV
jgi:RNA polymerase sigma-70 factor, ECF subfamily